MKNKNLKILTYILACLPLLAILILYSKLPQQVPTHWNLDNSIDYGDKSTLWLLCSMPLLMTLGFNVVPRIDPRGKNYQRFGKYYDAFCLFMVIFFDIFSGITLSESLFPGKISVGKLSVLLIGCLFVFLGNILPKLKNNFTFGIKTPWTLSDPDVWNKTHRLGGKLFFIMGLLLLITGFFLSETITFIIMFAGIAAIVILPTIMSYIWYSRITKSK